VPARQPKRGRLWLADGSCVRLRAERSNHVWSYDFVQDRTHDGRRIRMLTVIDEHTRECLALPVARRLRSDDVLATLADLFVQRGPPEHIRSDNGPEFTATAVREWLGRLGVKTAFIERGSPWENGYNEPFNAKLRDELLDREVFHTLAEARVLVGAWRRHYNTVRPHSALGYRPPAPETVVPPKAEAPRMPSGSAAPRLPSPMAQEGPMANITIGPPDGGRPDAPTAAGGARKFPEAASRRISFPSAGSDTALRSRPSSLSNSFGRFTWSVFSPPDSLRRRRQASCVTPIDRTAPATDRPCDASTSTSRSSATISSGPCLSRPITSSSISLESPIQEGPPPRGQASAKLAWVSHRGPAT
jgi:hypothetical protein